MKCRELYRDSLRLDAANDRLFRQRVRLSVFLQDNCQGDIRWPRWRLSLEQ